MNKDVIYIEPEDDITDILTGVKNSKAKIVALVPPKKTGVLRSAVNFKLLARTARESAKVVVLVTSDSALLKLAAVTGIPVAKNLQSKPEIPKSVALGGSKVAESDVIDGEEAAAITRSEKKTPGADEGSAIESIDLEESETEDDGERGDKKKSKKRSVVPNFERYRKFIIAGAIALVLIVGFVVWALALAPSAQIIVSVRTTARPFTETISFTTDPNRQDPSDGVFLLEAEKLTKQTSVEFEATGEVDRGEKATGTLTLVRTAPMPDAPIEVPVGTKFTRGNLVYASTEKATLRAPTAADCNFAGINCTSLKLTITAEVKVAAETAGEKYNVAAATSGWASAVSGFSISSSAMAGGTTRLINVVSASDVTRAQEKLTSANTSEGRTELLGEFPAGLIAITASFKTEFEDPVVTPAVGEEVGDGVIPKLVAKTTFSMFGVNRARIHEYIESKTEQAIAGEEGQTVYSTGVSYNADENKAFIESFREANGVYTARLKSNTKIGPEVTDQMVIDRSLGRKIGEVQSLLKSINGVSQVEIKTSFFWVTSVPNNINKVKVEITVE
jgi:hypothetical protein